MSVNFKNKLNDYANMTNHNVRCGKAGRLFIALKSYVVQGFPGGSEGKLPAMPETWVQSLGWEDPLEKEMATHSRTLAKKFHGWRSLVGYSPWGHEESDTTE